MGDTFQRIEKKYLLTKQQYDAFLERISAYMKLDQYGLHTICNIYYDTEHFDLIRRSLEKPVYKEKFRLRSYGVPTENDTVFLEIKKKYDGIVYKRRVAMPYREAMQFLDHKEIRPERDSQIMREIVYFHDYYKPRKAMFIAYDRMAYYGIEDENLRMTFDTNIRSREEHLELHEGAEGKQLLEKDQYLMEIKIPMAMPLWLTSALSELKIYPVSFSKYGRIYQNKMMENPVVIMNNVVNEGENEYVSDCFEYSTRAVN